MKRIYFFISLLFLTLGVSDLRGEEVVPQEVVPGRWELVTKASTLKVGDQVVIAAAEYDYALSTTQNTNNRGRAGIVKNKDNNTIWFGNDVQVLTLDKTVYTNTQTEYTLYTGSGYLYAASSNYNHLKETYTLAYAQWGIEINNKGIATIAGNYYYNNWLRYKSSEEIFSCYSYEAGKNLQDICIYRKKDIYTRSVTPGEYGTICLENNVTSFSGATFYEVAGREGNKVVFDEVTELKAGMPYIFIAEEETISLELGNETADTPKNHNSLQGTFTQIDPSDYNVLVGNYMLVNKTIKKCGANCGLHAKRAYFIAEDLDKLGAAPAQMPGCRRVAMGLNGENEETGLEEILNTVNPTKVIENGQFIIIREGVKYNIQGARL